jgi:protein O-mannosyl-transferase
MSTHADRPRSEIDHEEFRSARTVSFWDFPERITGRQLFLPYLLLLSITLALFGSTVYYNFVWDDFHYVLENTRIQGLSLANLKAIWTRPYFSQYAPFHISFLAVIHSISGLKPFGYHLSQVLLHSACVFLLYAVIRRTESARIAFLASLLFAVYPPGVETVAWISETKSTLAFLFFLLSFLFYRRSRQAGRWRDELLCGLFFALSLLSKLSTVFAPLIFLADARIEPARSQSKSNRLIACLFLLSAAAVAIQFAVRRSLLDTSHTLGDSSILDAASAFPAYATIGDFQVRLLNFPRLILFYLRMLIVPVPLSAWHMFRVYEGFNLWVAASWIALIGLLWILYRSPRRFQFWQLWFYIFLAPVLQLVANPIWVADRYLYVPAVGGFVIGAKLYFHALDRLKNRGMRLAWESAMAAVVIAFGWLTVRYVPVWRNDLTLWKETIETCPTSAYCHHDFGVALLGNGYGRLAVQELYRSVQLRPDPSYMVDLGDAYADGLANYPKAILAYQTAIKLGVHQLPGLWARLARAYFRSGQMEQANRALAAAGQNSPSDPELLVVRAFVSWKEGDLEAARGAIRLALAATGGRLDAPNLLRTYWGNATEAAQLLAAIGIR